MVPQVPSEPVVSTKTGHLFEKRLIEKQRQKELAEKRGDAIERKERTREERARLDAMGLQEME